MARLPSAEALGERPTPTLPRRTPLVADYRATSGFEDVSAQVLGHSAAELQTAAGIAFQAQDQHDTVRAEDAFNKARQIQIDMTYGKDGFARLKGGDAVNRPLLQEYGAAYDGAVAQIAGTLDNDYQRQLFTKKAQVSGIQLRSDAMKHVAQQSDVYAETSFKSGMATETKMMGMRWSEADGDALPLLRMGDLIEKAADRLGLQGDVRKAWVTEQTTSAKSKGYAEMVQAALASGPKGPFAAEAIMKVHGNEIDANTRLVLTHAIKQAVQPIEVRALAQDVVKSVVPQVGTELQIGGQAAVDSVTRSITTDTGGAPTARSVRNNNPGNIEKTSVKWEGEIEGSDSRFATFSTPEAGMRAMQKNLLAYQDKYGINTVSGIVGRWAPSSENGAQSTSNYAATVANALGVSPNEQIDLHDPATMQKVSTAMAAVEAGGSSKVASPQRAQTKIDTMALIGPAIAEGERRAHLLKPGDLVFANLVTQEIKSSFGTIALAEQAEQKKNYATLIGMIMPKVGADGVMSVGGVPQNKGPLPSLTDLMRNPDFANAYNGLDPIQQSGVQTHLRGLQDAALGKPMKEDGDTLEKVAGLIANKTIISKQQLLPYLNHGLGTHYYSFAEKLLDEAGAVGGVKINTAIERQRRSADSTLKRSMVGSIMPDEAADASEQYFIALQNKVDEYKNSDPPKDPATLFRTDTPDSMAKREVIMSYLKITPSAAVAKAAAAKNAKLPEPVNMANMTDAQADAAFEALPPGAPYIAPGPGNVKLQKRGVYAPPAAAAAAAAQTSAGIIPPPPESDVLPHERGRRAEADIMRREAERRAAANSREAEQRAAANTVSAKEALTTVRQLLAKDKLTTNELLHLESLKDTTGISDADKATIRDKLRGLR